MYCEFRLSIISNGFHDKYIDVKKGVLQGDSFSPFIFSFIIKTLIQCVKEGKFTNFGYCTFKGFLPHNWFQFADDAVAVTSIEGENQILLNIFSKWCRWSEMTVKASKCYSLASVRKAPPQHNTNQSFT